ncbi:MAG: sugar phosphate isomerase/epimerase family protein [Bryobacteraceae bacterium]
MRPAIQLYTVAEQLQNDFEGTLRKLAQLGFREVELAGLGGKHPREIRQLLESSGLTCRSGHLIQFWESKIDESIDAAAEMGLEYVVVPCGWKPDVNGIGPDPEGGPHAFAIAVLNSLTLDDWSCNAELLNRTGEKVRAAGMQLAYHNHNFEFRELGGICGFDELMRLTDPQLVKLELDPAWAQVAGADPVDLLRKHSRRVRLVHVRDFAPGYVPTKRLSLANAPTAAPPGQGIVDFDTLIPNAIEIGVEAMFVEREPNPHNLDRIAQDIAWLAPRISYA